MVVGNFAAFCSCASQLTDEVRDLLQVDALCLLADTESVALLYLILSNCHYRNQLRCDKYVSAGYLHH